MTGLATLKRLLLGLFLLVLCFSPISSEKKVSSTESILDSPIEELQYISHDIVLCRTSGGLLYRSTNGGRKWVNVTKRLREALSRVTRSASDFSSSPVSVASFLVNPAKKDIILVIGSKRRHFISSDAGESFRAVLSVGSIHNFIFHPTKPTWALMSRWSAGCDSAVVNVAPSPCRHDLFVTKDLAQTFQPIVDYVVQYSWGDVQRSNADSVFFTHHDRTSGSQPRVRGWSTDVHFSRVKVPGARIERLVPHGNKFLVSAGYIFVAKVRDSERQTVSLMVSTDGGTTFGYAKLPEELQERSYTILDTAGGKSVIIHVNHDGPSSGDGTVGGLGNVYISDGAGLRYSLSLPRNVRAPGGECEFDRVAGLEGVHIANYRALLDGDLRDKPAMSGLGGSEEDEDASETGIQARHRHGMRRGKNEPRIRTVITFDKGGVWSYLRPPRIDSRGKAIKCPESAETKGFAGEEVSDSTDPDQDDYDKPVCSLHLHGITNYNIFAPFYSVENAVGLVMGTGNVGEHLRYEDGVVNTYLSRDGGLNWVEAHKGSYIYEFGDHGGLIVMVNDAEKTAQVVFSWNEGQSWYDFDIGGDGAILVDNIIIEPNSSSVEFLLYGTRDGRGVVYHLDFATLGQPSCRGLSAPGSVSSDYETWTPTDGRTGDECILGRHMTFTRRKLTSECFNGKDFDRPVQSRLCACTERDYECDFGFTRKIGSFDCRPQDPALTTEGCTSSGIFHVNAYRRVPGDVCEGGWSPSKVPVLCPASSPFSQRARLILLSACGIAAALGLLTYCNSDPRLRGMISNVGMETVSNAKYAVIGGATRFLDALGPGAGTSGYKSGTKLRRGPRGVIVEPTTDAVGRETNRNGAITTRGSIVHFLDEAREDAADDLMDADPQGSPTGLSGEHEMGELGSFAGLNENRFGAAAEHGAGSSSGNTNRQRRRLVEETSGIDGLLAMDEDGGVVEAPPHYDNDDIYSGAFEDDSAGAPPVPRLIPPPTAFHHHHAVPFSSGLNDERGGGSTNEGEDNSSAPSLHDLEML